jgi:uncharacterized protein (TIGR02246 family)
MASLYGDVHSRANAQVVGKSKTSAQSAPADPRAADRAAVRTAMNSFVKAFESRDAAALAAHFTAEGEFKNDEGLTVHGQPMLQKGFSEFFAKTPEVTADVRPESLRFLSADSALEEGTVAVRRGTANDAKKAHYSALLVREEGRWRLAQLSETDPPEQGTSIDDLAWLIGEWKSTGAGGAEISTTYAWDANKKFIHVRFSVKEKSIALSGSQVIGVDPSTGGIHSWTFEAGGGVGEADWRHDGNHWVLDAAGTLPDGRTLTETNVLRRINDDTFTWQSVDRMLGDTEIPDLPPVKVTRIKPTR